MYAFKGCMHMSVHPLHVDFNEILDILNDRNVTFSYNTIIITLPIVAVEAMYVVNFNNLANFRY